MDNSSHFLLWLEDFIFQFVSLLDSKSVLGYSILDIFLGCLITYWILSKLRLASGSKFNVDTFYKNVNRDRRD